MTFPATWLVTGAGGLLGRELCALLRARGHTVLALSRHELDVTDAAAVRACLSRHTPGIVVNCAAWTAVDDAEQHVEEALRVNGTAPRHLARACAATRTRLLHVSTDHVLGGSPDGRPQDETALPAPLNAYGRTKLAGERAVLEELPDLGTVVRTAWLYGRHGNSFVRTMLRRAAEPGTVEVVDDQYGQPTWARDAARALLVLAGAPPSRTTGVFHATNTGSTSWYGLAREIFRLAGADPDRVVPITTDALGRPARRPAHSVLGHDRWRGLGAVPMRDWADALRDFHLRFRNDFHEEPSRSCAP